MSGLVDRITGRAKKAAGDLAGDENLRAQGVREERKADAKEELAEAQQKADLKAEEVANLERQTAGRGTDASDPGVRTGGPTDDAPQARPHT
jgi:uncharacterized protein YjbJ (UPF0337 family)